MSTASHPLERLLADPVFAALPPGSTQTGEVKTHAHNEPPVFGAGGTFGASYEIDFTSTAAPSEVFADVNTRAIAAGWAAAQKDRDGRTIQWAKAYPDGIRADLAVECLNAERTSPPYRCTLDGSI